MRKRQLNLVEFVSDSNIELSSTLIEQILQTFSALLEGPEVQNQQQEQDIKYKDYVYKLLAQLQREIIKHVQHQSTYDQIHEDEVVQRILLALNSAQIYFNRRQDADFTSVINANIAMSEAAMKSGRIYHPIYHFEPGEAAEIASKYGIGSPNKETPVQVQDTKRYTPTEQIPVYQPDPTPTKIELDLPKARTKSVGAHDFFQTLRGRYDRDTK